MVCICYAYKQGNRYMILIIVWHYEGGQFYVKSPEKWHSCLQNVRKRLENTANIPKKCNVDFVFHDLKLPRFDVPAGNGNILREICRSGIFKKIQKSKTRMETTFGIWSPIP